MLRFAAKATLVLRALLFYVTRIVCVVAFFGPFLGLGDCMAHLHAEKMKWNEDIWANLKGGNTYWDRKTVDLMYRLPDYTNYTIMTLKMASFIFIGVLLLHSIAIFILKMIVSSHFKETSWFNKIGHVVESINVPAAYKDFDVDLDPEETRTPEEYRETYNFVQKETFWMIFLQMVSNLLLLCPLFFAGNTKTFS